MIEMTTYKGGIEMEEKYEVLKGAESIYNEGSKTGILVIHGFTGTTESMKFLGDEFAKDGYTVCLPRLKGHGTHYNDLEESVYQEWIHSVEEGLGWLNERCDRIFVTGLSMGGTLTLYLAEKYDFIAGIIPINAAIDIPAMESLIVGDQPQYIDSIGSDIKAEGIEELSYDKTPVRSVLELLKLMKLVKEDLRSVHMPTLVFSSTEDHVVPPLNAELIMTHISSEKKKKVDLQNSYHVATMDHDKEEIVRQSLAFFRELS